jgi:hypothetical protein
MTSSDTIAAALSPEGKLVGRVAFVTGGTRGCRGAVAGWCQDCRGIGQMERLASRG